MWKMLKQAQEYVDQKGREHFAGLNSDGERLGATTMFACVLMLAGIAILFQLYIINYALIALVYAPELLREPVFWLIVFYYSLIFAVSQGSVIGAILGFGLGLRWQRKSRKAGLVCIIGGSLVVALMALFEAQFYDPSVPAGEFWYWALLLFCPGYLAATSMAAWGLSRLSVSD